MVAFTPIMQEPLIDSGEINSDGFIAKWQELGTVDGSF